MKRVTLCFLLLCLAFALVLPSGAARAQTPITLDTLVISLWPEFDKPQMLVLLDGTLAADVSLPVEVIVHIPQSVGSPTAVAVQNESGQLVDTPYTVASDAGGIAVTLQAKSAVFRIEYYDPALTINAETGIRDYAFQWVSDWPVREMTISVQEPVGASDLTADLALSPAGAGTYGLNYYSGSLGQMAAGQSINFQLRYSKSDAVLSADTLKNTTPLTSAMPPAAPQPSLLSPWLEIGLIVGVLLLAGGGFAWYWYSVHPWGAEARPARRRRRSRPAYNGDLAEDIEEARTGFCTQCGEPHLPGDRFCRKCGVALRE